jgi:hypothetical protein
VSGLGQDALVGREASADTEADQAAAIPGREPDEAGSAVGPRGWVVWVNEPGERNAVLLLGRGQRVGVADEARLEMTLREAISKEPFAKGGRTPFSSTERSPWRMTSASRLRLSSGMRISGSARPNIVLARGSHRSRKPRVNRMTRNWSNSDYAVATSAPAVAARYGRLPAGCRKLAPYVAVWLRPESGKERHMRACQRLDGPRPWGSVLAGRH